MRAQLLTADRPTDLLELVRHLTLLQLDPTTAVAPSADLVAWSRLGSAYSPDDLERRARRAARSSSCTAMLRPAEDIALFRAEMAAWPGAGRAAGLAAGRRASGCAANDECRRDILEAAAGRRAAAGPRAARTPACVPWRSSGLDQQPQRQRCCSTFMVQRGEVAAAGRRGPRPAVGPRRAGLPRRPGGARSRRRARLRDRAAAARPGHRPGHGPPRCPVEPHRRRRRPASRPWSRACAGKWRVDPA